MNRGSWNKLIKLAWPYNTILKVTNIFYFDIALYISLASTEQDILNKEKGSVIYSWLNYWSLLRNGSIDTV